MESPPAPKARSVGSATTAEDPSGSILVTDRRRRCSDSQKKPSAISNPKTVSGANSGSRPTEVQSVKIRTNVSCPPFSSTTTAWQSAANRSCGRPSTNQARRSFRRLYALASLSISAFGTATSRRVKSFRRSSGVSTRAGARPFGISFPFASAGVPSQHVSGAGRLLPMRAL